ncbi:MAG: hypothetical protein HMLIMOIP_002149 [Candidatus Nitrosomirales archaeon]|jgi:hypothetical protein
MPKAEGHQVGFSFSALASVAPTIDGTIDETEWADADRKDFTSGGYAGTVFVMNDSTNLYIALRTADVRLPEIYFDNNHNGLMEVYDDLIDTWQDSGVWDRHIVGTDEHSFADIGDTQDEGTNDGSWDSTDDGTYSYYEFSHPLRSTDTLHDFCLSEGDTVGFTVGLNGWGPMQSQTLQPKDASWYGDIVIAGVDGSSPSCPQFDIPPTPSTLIHNINTDETFSITIQCSDPDLGDSVRIFGRETVSFPHNSDFSGYWRNGLPWDATLTPAAPNGNPASAIFAWTPGYGQDVRITLTCTDTDGKSVNYNLHFIVSDSGVHGLDIKPNQQWNSISCAKTKGAVPVAIYTDQKLDAQNINFDLSSLTFNGNSVREKHGTTHLVDLDDDGDLDVKLHLLKSDVCRATKDLSLNVNYPEIEFTFESTEGQQFIFVDNFEVRKR